MAIEDGAVLANCIDNFDKVEEALKYFEKKLENQELLMFNQLQEEMQKFFIYQDLLQF